MKEKNTNISQNTMRYTHTKGAYDGNMEYTNLKASKSVENSQGDVKKGQGKR